MHVSEHQGVSVNGSYPSLRALLEDLAWRGGFELRSFDPPDHPIAAAIQDQPLTETLQRLLRGESYLLGMASAPDGHPRVVWLAVLGTYEEARARRGKVVPVPLEQSLTLPSEIFRAAFSEADTDQRRDALAAIERQIASDPARVEAFLRTDVVQLTQVLRRLPDAVAYLTATIERQADPRIREKLRAILRTLEPSDSANRVAEDRMP